MEPPSIYFGCKCRRCYSYKAPDDGATTNCAACECPPSDHSVMMRVDPDEDDDDLPDPSCYSVVPMSGTASAPPSETTSWSLTDSDVTDFASLLDTKSKKRAADDLGGEPAKKKPKGATTGPKTDKDFNGNEGLLKMKPCKVLQTGHIPFTEMEQIPYDVRGVYKIAFNWQTIYVGSNSCKIKTTLKSHFSGHGRVDLFDYIKRLSQKDLEKVTVYYLDETKYVHNCPKKSYMKCIEDLQGARPMFNLPLNKNPTSKWWCNVQ
ncbi:uncharacterized protein [Haliotis asinina]|uniref:uncharacterized protein n=1 Tax=Haliotis asinina TaxID=109174 RepID=UPI003531D5C8